MQYAVLRNPRHEIYCHGIIAGLSPREAYVRAGFQGKPGTEKALAGKPLVKARIKELLEHSSRKAELSRKQILDRIFEDWETSRKLGQMPAALKAAHMLGQEMHRMFVERKEVGGPGDFDNKSEEELKQIISDEIRDLGWDEKDIPPPASAIN